MAWKSPYLSKMAISRWLFGDLSPPEVPQDVLEDAIIAAIRANPKVSREEIAQKANVSSKTIARKMNKMRDKIRFVGRGYSGHWEVVENS